VLCTFNERGSIGGLIDDLLALGSRCDVLVIDDSSTDGTVETLAARPPDPRVGVILRPRKLGLGSGQKLGWLHARHLGYTTIVTMDADLSHDPADVQRLCDCLDAGADIAVGSRFMPGGRLDYSGRRLLVSRYANVLASYVLGLPLTEYTTSLRAVRLERVPAGLIETVDNDGYSFFVASITRLLRAGLRPREVPIHFRERHHGASKISRWEILYGLINLSHLAVDRRSYATPADYVEALPCPVCARPYVAKAASGELRCLACFGSLDGN
jgi:glycosyltransferase involved in cell wall biosynthesis